MNFEERWNKLRAEVADEIDICNKCTEFLDKLFDNEYNTQHLLCLRKAYGKVTATMDALVKT